MYNFVDAFFYALTQMLRRRTEAFASIHRDVNSILDFKHATQDSEPKKRPFPDFHHCPYLGLVGKKYSRVGCLLHPQVRGNNGIDFRGLSYYGEMACRVYFCPSYSQLSGVVKGVVREAAVDWYSYGLVVTEALMLSAFFLELERRLDRSIQPEFVAGNEKCLKLIQKFLNLKLHRPFRSRPDPGPINYFFKDNLYCKPPIDYNSIGALPSRYDVILRELVSVFDTHRSLQLAEGILDDIIERLVFQISAER